MFNILIMNKVLDKKNKETLFDKTFFILTQSKNISTEDCKKITDVWNEYDQLYKQYVSEPLKYMDELRIKTTYVKDTLKELAIKYNIEIKI